MKDLDFDVARIATAAARMAEDAVAAGTAVSLAVAAMGRIQRPWGDDGVSQAFAANYLPPAETTMFNVSERSHQLAGFAANVRLAGQLLGGQEQDNVTETGTIEVLP